MEHSWYDSHIVWTLKSFSKALYATLGIFLIFFVLFHIGSAFYLSSLSEESAKIFNDGIGSDKKYLKDQGDILSRDPQVKEAILSKDHTLVLKTIQKEKLEKNIGLLGIADANGNVIGRTINPGRYGDNVFLTIPTGRVVQNKISVESIELTGFKDQMFLTTSRPVLNNNDMIGALFASYLMDDEYAKHFKEKYLSPDDQIVFYTKKYGVYGNSFIDQDTRALIDSYFNTGSDWVVNGVTGKTVVVDGKTYLVENIVFSGLESSPGGALLFTPRKDISGFANFVTALFTLCTFVFFAIRNHCQMKADEKSWRYYVLLCVVAVPVFILTLVAFFIQNAGRIHIDKLPFTIYNSTLNLDPEYGIFNLGFDQRLTIVVNTGGEEINVAQIALKFNPEDIAISALEIASSTCPYVVENKVDQMLGTISIVCGIDNSIQKNKIISIADVVVRPLRLGSVSLSFDPIETKIFANDGLGTNVLRMSQDSSYRVIDFDFLQSDVLSDEDGGQKFMVFSPSHNNESRWYNSQNADFYFRSNLEPNYRYSFDMIPDTVPNDDHIIGANKISLPVPGDGIYYFHLQHTSGGQVFHYKIKSDRTAPTVTSMLLSQDKIFAGDVVRFSFSADDTASGVQYNYYVDLGGHLFLPVGKDMFVPFIDKGNQAVTLRVYDNAGNYTESSKTVHVLEK